MPEVILKADPTQKKVVSQDDAISLIRSGEWAAPPGQSFFLRDSEGRPFTVDSERLETFIGAGSLGEDQGVVPESSESIIQRGQREQDLDEYVRGTGNRLLGLAESGARGLFGPLGDMVYGDKATRLRREEGDWVNDLVEIGAMAAPAFLTGGTSALAQASRFTQGGLFLRGAEAARLATISRLGVLGEAGALGKAGRAIIGGVAAGAAEGALYGASEAGSTLALSDDPVSVESAFNAIGSSALHGGLLGGGIGGIGAGAGELLGHISRSIDTRLTNALDTEGRQELAERVAKMADPDIKRLHAEASKQLDDEMTDLLEKQAQARRTALEAEGESASAQRLANIEREFAAERAALAEQAALKEKTLGQLDEIARKEIHEKYGYKRLADDAEFSKAATQFSGELQDTYETFGKVNRLIQMGADATGNVAPMRAWKGKYAQFKEAFVKGGKLIRDPEELAQVLVNPANRQLLLETEKQAAISYGEIAGKEMFFDNLLANYKVTDEFINASKLKFGEADRKAFHDAMFDKHMGLHQQDVSKARDELLASGKAQMDNIKLREGEAIMRMQADERLRAAVDFEKFDALTKKVEELKGKFATEGKGKGGAIPKDLEKQIIDNAHQVMKIGADAGLKMNMVDGLGIAASLGYDLTHLPAGSLKEAVLKLYGVAKMTTDKGPSNLVAAVMERLGEAAVGYVATKALGLDATGLAGIWAVRSMVRGGATSVIRSLADHKTALLSLAQKSVNAFLRVGKVAKPLSIAAPVKVLNSVSFLGEPGEHIEHRDVYKAFNARAEELSRAVQNPELVMQTVADRIGLLRYQDPRLAAQLGEIALRRIQFLYDKLPKNPGLGVFGQDDFWRPSDYDISRWTRYIQGTDDIKGNLEAFGAGRLTREQAEGMAITVPAVLEKLKFEAYETAASSPNKVGYTQRIQLSMLFGQPVDFTQQAGFVNAMQANFTSNESQPANEEDMGRLTSSAFGADKTPAQRMQEK